MDEYLLTRILTTSPVFWSNLAQIISKQLKDGSFDSLNLAMMSCMLDSLAQVLRTAVIKRDDISDKEFQEIREKISLFVKQTSGNIVDILSRADGR